MSGGWQGDANLQSKCVDLPSFMLALVLPAPTVLERLFFAVLALGMNAKQPPVAATSCTDR